MNAIRNFFLRIIDAYFRMTLTCEKYAEHIGVNIGDQCQISTYKFGSEPYLISIGDRTRISRDVTFVTHDGSVWHHRTEVPDLDVFGKISIGSDSYIGPNTYILPGVEIGDHCIIGANSVVSRSIPNNSVAAGSPIKYLGTTTAFYKKMEGYNAKTKGLSASEKKERLSSAPSEIFIQRPFIKI